MKWNRNDFGRSNHYTKCRQSNKFDLFSPIWFGVALQSDCFAKFRFHFGCSTRFRRFGLASLFKATASATLSALQSGAKADCGVKAKFLFHFVEMESKS
jgi:hypothetical protein